MDMEEKKDFRIWTLCNNQQRELRRLGFPREAYEELGEKQPSAISVATEKVRDGNIPLVPVINGKGFDLKKLMSKVEYDGKTGYAHLRLAELSTSITVPGEPYFLLDVSLTSEVCTLEESAAAIDRDTTRSGMTAEEIIFVAMVCGILPDRYLVATRSHFSEYGMISLHLKKRRPRLIWVNPKTKSSAYLTCSCGGRI